jgi:hypothetical protein
MYLPFTIKQFPFVFKQAATMSARKKNKLFVNQDTIFWANRRFSTI